MFTRRQLLKYYPYIKQYFVLSTFAAHSPEIQKVKATLLKIWGSPIITFLYLLYLSLLLILCFEFLKYLFIGSLAPPRIPMQYSLFVSFSWLVESLRLVWSRKLAINGYLFSILSLSAYLFIFFIESFL